MVDAGIKAVFAVEKGQRRHMTDKKIDFDTAAKLWDDNERRVKMVHDIAGAIKENFDLNDTMDVLDFGCGTGLLSLQLQPFVKTVTGADPSQGMLDALAAKIEQHGISNYRLIHLEEGSREKLTGKYDLVMSSMTFHHVEDIPPLIQKLKDILKPGGRVCIADLDPDNGLFHRDNTGVFHDGFDREMMKAEFERAGFIEIKASTAAEVVRPGPEGEDERFTVFLICAKKR